MDFSSLDSEFQYDTLVKLLSEPLESLKLKIIQFKEYPKLLNILPADKKKKVAQSIFNAALGQGLNSEQELKQLLEFVDSVINDGENIEKLWTVFKGEEYETMLMIWEERVRQSA